MSDAQTSPLADTSPTVHPPCERCKLPHRDTARPETLRDGASCECGPAPAPVTHAQARVFLKDLTCSGGQGDLANAKVLACYIDDQAARDSRQRAAVTALQSAVAEALAERDEARAEIETARERREKIDRMVSSLRCRWIAPGKDRARCANQATHGAVLDEGVMRDVVAFCDDHAYQGFRQQSIFFERRDLPALRLDVLGGFARHTTPEVLAAERDEARAALAAARSLLAQVSAALHGPGADEALWADMPSLLDDMRELYGWPLSTPCPDRVAEAEPPARPEPCEHCHFHIGHDLGCAAHPGRVAAEEAPEPREPRQIVCGHCVQGAAMAGKPCSYCGRRVGPVADKDCADGDPCTDGGDHV